jgi:hypothetical protein
VRFWFWWRLRHTVIQDTLFYFFSFFFDFVFDAGFGFRRFDFGPATLRAFGLRGGTVFLAGFGFSSSFLTAGFFARSAGAM